MGSETTYQAVYKCRLCGRVFVDSEVKEHGIKRANLLHITLGNPIAHDMTYQVNERVIHFCEGEDTGIADFQGFKAAEEC